MRMIDPEGRTTLEIPEEGVHAMRALGWKPLELAPEEKTPQRRKTTRKTTAK